MDKKFDINDEATREIRSGNKDSEDIIWLCDELDQASNAIEEYHEELETALGEVERWKDISTESDFQISGLTDLVRQLEAQVSELEYELAASDD
jgi:hypothetical protein